MSSARTDATRILIVDDDRVVRLALRALLADAGYDVAEATDAAAAVEELQRAHVDLMLVDIGLPGRSGLDLLADVQAMADRPRVVVITADDTPQSVLRALQAHAHRYVTKPFAPRDIVTIVGEVLGSTPAHVLPIQVISARPEWVELVVPCALEVADRVQPFLMQLDANLPDSVRESVGQAFRELLCNAIEWGGRLDPSRTVRIACLRTERLLLYRIEDPGEGFDIEKLRHAAICNPEDNPLQHADVREQQGLRPGGLGLVLTRALVDELIYNEKRNEVVFLKYLR